MTESESTPLLAEQRQRRSGETGQASTSTKRHNGTAKPSATIPIPNAITPPDKLKRILFALRDGKLPDNNQLYTLFTSAAAFLETISDATAPSQGQDGQALTPGDDLFKAASSSTGVAPKSDDPQLLLAAILAETSAFSRLLARWLHGTDGAIPKTKAAPGKKGGNGEQKPQELYEAPRGNANEQIQRLIWHAGQALSSGPQGGIVEVDAEGGLEGGAREAYDAVKDAAVEAQQDATSGVKSLARIVAAVLSSDELMRIPSDIIRSLSGQAADILEEVSQRTANVEEVLRKESAPDKPDDDFAPPKQALQEGVDTIANAADAAVTHATDTSQAKSKAKTETWEDETAKRLARLMDELGQDETFTRAIDKTAQLIQKYMRAADKAKTDVSATVEEAKDVADDALHPSLDAKTTGQGSGTDDDLVGATATLSSDALEATVSAHFSHHAVEAMTAAREVIEGLAGGRSMQTVVDRAEELRELALENSSTRKWVEDVMDFVQENVKEVEAVVKGSDRASASSRDEKTERIKEFILRLQDILKEQPKIEAKYNELKRDVRDIAHEVQTNASTMKMAAHCRHLRDMARDLFVVGTREARKQTTNVYSRLFNALLPSVGKVLGYIPLPRVEFASENLDATIEDINIAALQLIPETMQFSTTNDWQYDRRSDVVGVAPWHTNTSARFSFGGLRLALKDISFFVQERFSAPSEEGCCGCCSFGHSSSRFCFFRGPSSWFAYTERAIMDVGFGNEGVSVDIDVEDAGRSAKEWREARRKQREERRKQLNSKSKGNVDVDAARQRYGSDDEADDTDDDKDDDEDDENDNKKGQRRTTFFNVKDCHVNVSNSFDFQFRDSRHWLINGMVRYTTRPLIRTILRRVMAAQISHAFSAADSLAWDYHARAKYLHRRRLRYSTSSMQASRKLTKDPTQDFPSLSDYFRVVVDGTAGKSPRRIEREKRTREREEREKREQEAKDREEQSKQTQQQPSGRKSMEVKASGLAMHDEEGDYSIAIGFTSQPGTVLRDSRVEQRGPATKRTRVREAATNPRDTLATAQEYGSALHKVALDVAKNTASEVKQSASSTASQLQSAARTSSDSTDADEGEDAGTDPGRTGNDPDGADDGWRTVAFDLDASS